MSKGRVRTRGAGGATAIAIAIAIAGAMAFAGIGCGGAARPPLAPPESGPKGGGGWEGASGSFAPPPRAADAPSGWAPAPASPRSSATAEASAGAARPGWDDAARAPSPRDRSGLGTAWGETRTSRTHDVSFTRADASRPFAVTTFHYDDRRGVAELGRMHGGWRASREEAAAGGAIGVSIRDGAGDPLEALRVGDRTYVVGDAGERYAIVVVNHTGHRFEAVATVDGLDVIDGEAGSFEHRGYVLGPWATLEIDGFRKNHDEVAAFRFSSTRDSYAAKTGSARDVGVIGVAFFDEENDRWDVGDDLWRRDGARPFPREDDTSRFAQPPRD